MTDPAVTTHPFVARHVIRASAGSGKTYRLSSRLIALLAADVPPREILASTFTRKAAGEITSRVLLRLAGAATDLDEAELLANTMPDALSRDRLTLEGCSELLARLVHGLHRLQIQTLDAFFYRVARTFALELGLPQNWRLAHDPDRERLYARAVEATLREMDPRTVRELVHGAGHGGADRGVQRLLQEGVERLHEIYRALDPEATSPWGLGLDEVAEPDPSELQELILRYEAAPLPKTRKGGTDSGWEKARSDGVDALRSGDWEGFLRAGLGRAIGNGSGKYRGKEIPPTVLETLTSLTEIARNAYLSGQNRRLAALGRFLPEYDRRLQRLQREERLYHFDDITWALSNVTGSARSPEVAYRLDHRIRHLLLDEFQDTSFAQWAALESFTGDILTGTDPSRTIFIVSDPKQSIYGWRGGEPRLLDEIQERLGLTAESVSENRRSAEVVLEAVNRVFGRLGELTLWEPEDRDAVHGWAEAFEAHHPAQHLAGHVCVEVGPAETPAGSRTHRPALLEHAASRVIELHRSAPTTRIGVLTRTNRSAAYLLAQLRREGLEASEEGGVPVADSAPVAAILALLRLADHPADLVSRYVVRKTPARQLLRLPPGGWDDDDAFTQELRALRGLLLDEGYGPVLSGWTRALRPLVSERDFRRLRRLAELGHRWDERATGRPSDFVRVAEAARREDPQSAPIRVMTIHGAKGLEFDAVVLPDLDGLYLTGDRNPIHATLRKGKTGPVVRVLPQVSQELLPHFPQLADGFAQAREIEIRDGLGALYVALTRARQAVYVYVSPDPRGTSRARTGARLVREALAPTVAAVAVEGSILYRDGPVDWWRDQAAQPRPPASRPVDRKAAEAPKVLRLAPSTGRRMLPRRTPSGATHGWTSLDRLVLGRDREARDRGIVVHHWLALIEWIETGVPGDDELLAEAKRQIPWLDGASDLLAQFHRWITRPPIRRILSRDSFPPDTRVSRELAFIARTEASLVEGRADRVLYLTDADGPRLLVVDWKSDLLDSDDPAAMAQATESYRPQLEAYLEALSRTERIPLDRVEGVVAFVAAGAVSRILPNA